MGRGAAILVNDVEAQIDDVDRLVFLKGLSDQLQPPGIGNVVRIVEQEERRAELGGANDEDVLSYIAFPAQAEKFFAAREEKRRRSYAYTIREVSAE